MTNSTGGKAANKGTQEKAFCDLCGAEGVLDQTLVICLDMSVLCRTACKAQG